MSQTGGRIWSSLVHTDYSNRVVDCCWLDRCFSCKLLNISTHCLFWFSMTLSLVIHEYLNSRAIHNEVLFLSFSWLVLYLQFLILVSNFNFLLFLDSSSWHYKSSAYILLVLCFHHVDFIVVDFYWQHVTGRLTTRGLRLWNRLRSSNSNEILLRDRKRYQKCEERKDCYLVTI